MATLLVIGFALHNATEGFGIVAPLMGETDADGTHTMPSWAVAALRGHRGRAHLHRHRGGASFTSEATSVVFLSLAAGSILYVVMQLISIAAKTRRMDLLAYGVLIGLMLGFLTDAIVTAAGV